MYEYFLCIHKFDSWCRGLSDDDFEPQDFRQFFGSLETSLAELTIAAYHIDIRENMLLEFYSSISQLRILYMSFQKISCMDSLMKVFVTSDCLEDFTFELDEWSDQIKQAVALELSTCVLNSLNNQRRLKKLVVEFYWLDLDDEQMFHSTISNAVQSFRFRTTYIRVAGRDYFN